MLNQSHEGRNLHVPLVARGNCYLWALRYRVKWCRVGAELCHCWDACNLRNIICLTCFYPWISASEYSTAHAWLPGLFLWDSARGSCESRGIWSCVLWWHDNYPSDVVSHVLPLKLRNIFIIIWVVSDLRQNTHEHTAQKLGILFMLSSTHLVHQPYSPSYGTLFLPDHLERRTCCSSLRVFHRRLSSGGQVRDSYRSLTSERKI